jgi:hypothetical protein
VAPPESETHRIAVLKQDNGELQEDVVDRAVVEPVPGDDPFEAADDDDDVGEDVPPRGSIRVVESRPVEEVEERPDPDSPIPGTLPAPPRP